MCIGTYTFQRTIDDRYSRITHQASGMLHICQTAWNENGVLHSLDNAPFYQRYLLDFTAEGVCVSYPNGAEFYRLPHIHGTHHIRHQCGDDVYQGTWAYETTTLHLSWDVKGPRKEYTMITVYTLQNPI